MAATNAKTPVTGKEPVVKPKIDFKGNQSATLGGKGEKRDATSPPIPPKPQLEKKTRDETAGDAADTTNDTDTGGDIADEQGSPSHIHVFSKPMHPSDIVQIVNELRGLMLPEIKTIISDNTPDTKTIVFEAVKKATLPLTKNINDVVTENNTIKERCSKLEKRVAELESANNTRKLETDALEQYGRRNFLRVSGIPDTPNEDTDFLGILIYVFISRCRYLFLRHNDIWILLYNAY